MNESIQCHVDPSHPILRLNDDGSCPPCEGCKEDFLVHEALRKLEQKLNEKSRKVKV